MPVSDNAMTALSPAGAGQTYFPLASPFLREEAAVNPKNLVYRNKKKKKDTKQGFKKSSLQPSALFALAKTALEMIAAERRSLFAVCLETA